MTPTGSPAAGSSTGSPAGFSVPTGTRRGLLAAAVGAPLLGASAGCARQEGGGAPTAPADPPYKISLAQWSLNRHFYTGGGYHAAMGDKTREEFTRLHREAFDAVFNGELKPIDFPLIARREFDIGAIEYVNRFLMPYARDEAYLGELKKRCDGEGVKSLLIMVDDEGDLGDPDDARRAQAIENHHQWADAAAFLGCHSIRVNARSEGSWADQVRLAAEGLSRLAEYAAGRNVNVIVENHGGLSSNGAWLAEVMRTANNPRVGTLPDFGNFKISETESYDPYQGTAELMPFAKGVSAKCYAFDAQGLETTLDFPRLMQIVTEAGYRGHVGIEFEGDAMDEMDGIRAAKALLERIAADMSRVAG